MAMGMYNAFVPVCTKGLAALGKIMEKAQAHCEAKKIPEGNLLNMRLTPDMFSLAQQIGVATQQVHWGCALLAGLERPTLPTVEPTFADVKKRIDDAIAYAKTFKPEQIDGQEERDVVGADGVAEVSVPKKILVCLLRTACANRIIDRPARPTLYNAVSNAANASL